jgi:hypothetical protein
MSSEKGTNLPLEGLRVVRCREPATTSISSIRRSPLLSSYANPSRPLAHPPHPRPLLIQHNRIGTICTRAGAKNFNFQCGPDYHRKEYPRWPSQPLSCTTRARRMSTPSRRGPRSLEFVRELEGLHLPRGQFGSQLLIAKRKGFMRHKG